MITRLLPRPPVLYFIARNPPFLQLRSNLLPWEGKLKSKFGGNLNVRSMSGSGSFSTLSHVLLEKQVEQVDRVLAGKEDEHGGVIVEMSTEPMVPIMFTSLLKASMLHWKQKGIWIKLPIELANLIEPVVKVVYERVREGMREEMDAFEHFGI